MLDFVSSVELVEFEATTEANFSSPYISCTSFSIQEDRIAFEGEESFLLQILPPQAAGQDYEIGQNSTANVTILDNDGE